MNWLTCHKQLSQLAETDETLTPSQVTARDALLDKIHTGEPYINLYGHPGSGKTFLAHYLHHRADVLYFSHPDRYDGQASQDSVVAIDNATHTRPEARQLSDHIRWGQKDYNGPKKIILITRQPIHDDVRKIELTLTASDTAHIEDIIQQQFGESDFEPVTPYSQQRTGLWRYLKFPFDQGSVADDLPGITELTDTYRALWELCLNDYWCPLSVTEWREHLDSTCAIEDPAPTLFLNLPESEKEELRQVFGFRLVTLPVLPTLEQVNSVLPHRFENNNLRKQSELATEITSRISDTLPQIAVLLVFDGLSFYETTTWDFPNATLEPCLVDGLSITDHAMRRLMGSPVLTHRLFELGYVRRLGFSYWQRSANSLANALFSEFPETQLHRVATFEEVLNVLAAAEWHTQTYVQIIRSGLDGVCHAHRERPNINVLLEKLKQDIDSLITMLRGTGKSFRLFITADHGILWHHEQSVVPLAHEKSKARYTEGAVASEGNVLTLKDGNGTYTVLIGDKVIAKTKKSNEWGFHGGISAQESLVPFWDIRL